MSHEDFNIDLIVDSDSENSNTTDSDCDDNDQTATVAFFELAREGNKLKKILFKENIGSAIRKLTSTMTTLKYHMYVKRVQYENNLGRNDILVHDDYIEVYESKHQQHEIQSAYFGHTSFSVFIACCYLQDSDNKRISE